MSAAAAAVTVPPLKLSGLEPVLIGAGSLFVNIGERTNVTGSKAFARLILNEFEGPSASPASRSRAAPRSTSTWTRRCSISKAAMVRFPNLIAGEPESRACRS
jgi:5-methyltetrahydrofolate--homocysteine methyltransferase